MSIPQIEINMFTWELLSLCKFTPMTQSCLQTWEGAALGSWQNSVAVLSVYICSSWFYKIGSDKPPRSWMGSSPQGSLVSHQCRGTSRVTTFSSVVVNHTYSSSYKGTDLFFFFWGLKIRQKNLEMFRWFGVDIFTFNYSFAELVIA